jgi:uncharacterized protein (TIGR03086 family)
MTSMTQTDPRPLFADALATAAATVAAVRPDQLTAPTPCTEFDVRALLAHLVAVVDRIAAVGRGADPFSVPFAIDPVADDAWEDALATAVTGQQAVWADDAVLGAVLTLPFGTLPGAAALTSYTGELVTHTWDLAVATGQTPRWSEPVLRASLASSHGKLPQAVRPPQVPFADAVPVPDDAPLIEQVVAWQGRDPRWTP